MSGGKRYLTKKRVALLTEAAIKGLVHIEIDVSDGISRFASDDEHRLFEEEVMVALTIIRSKYDFETREETA